MRVPVYPRGADPRVASPILRKSFYFAAQEVLDRLADWVDPDEPRKGIIPREFLPSGKVVPVSVNELQTRFVANCRLMQPDQPTRYGNEKIAAVRIQPKSVTLPSWDWDHELQPA